MHPRVPARRGRRLPIAVALSQSRVLARGFIPYIVASQTIPLLAIAPMVVVGLGSKGVKDWISVAVLAAYLTFFPVAINTLARARVSRSARGRADASRTRPAAGRSSGSCRCRARCRTSSRPSGSRRRSRVVGAIIAEPAASIQGGLGGAIVNFSQYYSIEPQELWATNIITALLGIVFFLAIVVVEKLVVHRAPEHYA